jgi:hypothetical protein
MRCVLLYPYLVLFLSVLFHTLFNFTDLSPFYLISRFSCCSSFFGTEPPLPDMSNMQLYSVG